MAKFRKATLKVGQYISPDGPLKVTRERLRHWADQFSVMKRNRQVVPIGWDHSDIEDDLKPISLSAFKQRSAEHTIGRLVDFRPSEDGQSAELLLDVRTPRAKEAAKLNNVYVSPVIFEAWQDGDGRQYEDVITHVDFVNHPVDHSQGPFVPVDGGHLACAIRMGLSGPYRMALEDSNVADDDKKAGSGDGDETTSDKDGKLKAVIDALAKMDIVLSDDTNTDNFLDHLEQALLTAAAHRGEDETDGGDGGEVVQEDAAYATMSLEAKSALAYAERTHRQQIKAGLDALLKDGRCTPAEHKQQLEQLPAVKLSLDADGNPKTTRLEDWIDSRASVPKGTFWDDSKKTRLSVVPAPSSFTGDLSKDEVDGIVKEVLGRG